MDEYKSPIELLHYISREVSGTLKKINPLELARIEEIRMRAGRPLMVCFNGSDRFVKKNGRLVGTAENVVVITGDCIKETMELISKNSLYSCMEELQNGFITLEGGHRVGVSGRVVYLDGNIRNIKDISGLNIRVAKEVKGCCRNILKYLIRNNEVCNSLIVSPPQCGKTTMLRDIARALSDGELGYMGFKVGIIDERSEIASSRNGIPQFDVGVRTDVLDGCPKNIGMQMMIRSMSPEVMLTDEIGNSGDSECIMKVLNAGIKIITSAHGYSVAEMKSRREVLSLIRNKAFERYIVLSGKEGPGTLEEVVDGNTMKAIYRRIKSVS